MPFKIYPSIGIARVGNSPSSFCVGPEFPGHPGIDIQADGTETTLTQYKEANSLIKRQGARFRIFEVDNAGENAQPLTLQPGDNIEWKVRLTNKKAAVQRGNAPRTVPTRPVVQNADLIISPSEKSISGANDSAEFNDGSFLGRTVKLGNIVTDSNQNLIVLGGAGFSSSPTNQPIQNFYTSRGWHDDTSDGIVSARVIRATGEIIDDVVSSWCIVSTPDYAPGVGGIVTLYDILKQVGASHHGLSVPVEPSFQNDIFPILFRTSQLRWVNENDNFADLPRNWQAASDKSDSNRALRRDTANFVHDAVRFLSDFSLTDIQSDYLDKYVDGDFNDDWSGLPPTTGDLTPANLTHAALDAAVGQGFFPGIEAGIIVKDPTLYTAPFDFRFDPSNLEPGDITALMAVPWQADFFACQGSWWPAQRPDSVFTTPDNNSRFAWQRGVSGMRELVDKFPGLGFVVPDSENLDPKFIEKERADDAFFL